jgi:hypothetical protein
LHTGAVVAARDRTALERLGRCGARAAFAQERLAWTADGRIASKLKRPATPADPRASPRIAEENLTPIPCSRRFGALGCHA